ncbi:MAG: hypothetical protein AAF223_04655, partial [Bacteroidota bacterium]
FVVKGHSMPIALLKHRLLVASIDSRELVHCAFRALERIFRMGYQYTKCGVIVSGLVPENARQLGLFETIPDQNKSSDTQSSSAPALMWPASP